MWLARTLIVIYAIIHNHSCKKWKMYYKILPFSKIYFIYSNGPSFDKTNRPGIYVKFDKHIPKIYTRERGNTNCTYLTNFIYVLGYGTSPWDCLTILQKHIKCFCNNWRYMLVHVNLLRRLSQISIIIWPIMIYCCQVTDRNVHWEKKGTIH